MIDIVVLIFGIALCAVLIWLEKFILGEKKDEE